MAENDDLEPPSKIIAISIQQQTESLCDIKSKVVEFLRKRLRKVYLHYHDFLAELAYLQGGGLLVDYDLWRRQRPQELMHALCSGHLDTQDLTNISAFMSGHLPIHELFPVEVDTSQADVEEDDSDDEVDRCIDETAIVNVVRREMETLKRVLELKRRGLWSRDIASPIITSSGGGEKSKAGDTNITTKPSLSSLAPLPELTRTKDHSEYLFAELRWLAEDFKKERHWKKVSAKKLAFAALKSYKEKAERSQKAEKEEMLRVRKQCAFIARMIRDWWRQMDKIVQTKQKARLTAKHQAAMSTHLGHVIETTEQYTKWLTEGITGAKTEEKSTTKAEVEKSPVNSFNTKKSKKKRKKCVVVDDSDEEFSVAEDSEDDEETIAKEEEVAQQELEKGEGNIAMETESDEIAALCKEAEASIDDLLPPGYLEHLRRQYDEDQEDDFHPSSSSPPSLDIADEESQSQQTTCSTSHPPHFVEKQKHKRDTDFTLKSENYSDDGVTTVVKEQSPTIGDDDDEGPSKLEVEEMADLASEAEMPINDLLKRYGLDMAQQIATNNQGAESLISGQISGSSSSTEDEKDGSIGSDSSSSSSSSDEDVSLKELLKEEVDENVPKEPVSLVEEVPITDKLPSDNEEALTALTVEAMSAQPQGNTLASVPIDVKPPFLLTGTLREYQVVGLSWLAAIYEKRLNGILADEMGLGKTIQTIALLAHLACGGAGIWGPHLIVVPTSVILNWEVEFKRWCPGFKILTYFGNMKERKMKRKGWTKTNAFHVCITSYRLAIQDSAAFKRKKWKYLILDEAQNIKNFKSQRWQTLLTFNSQRRLLLTGTPLQNSLMELWSLMHFLMPNIFQSHREFQEWFASPLTGMIEGNNEYNEQLVIRLHKVLRPFLLRRLKVDVERQMPKKYEHIVLCRLSKRQRYLYDDFMSLSATRETLSAGQFLSVMNILMQLRKVCNHPNLFEPRPITSPFFLGRDDVCCEVPRLIANASYPFLVALAPSCGRLSQPVCTPSAHNTPDLDWLDRAGAAARLLGQSANIAEMARDLPAFVAKRINELRARPNLISVIDTSNTIDSVGQQREFFAELKEGVDEKLETPSSLKRHRQPSIFLPRSVVSEINEEIAHASSYYSPGQKTPFPSLPRPTVRAASFVPAEPPVRHWDNGLPKSVLRSRRIERQYRLSLLARINERRCTDFYSSCSPSNAFETSMPTPDLVFHITNLLRAPQLPSGRCLNPSESPFAVDAWVACQRVSRIWPDKRACGDTDGPPNYQRNPIDTVGGLLATATSSAARERVQACLGPEASFTRKWTSVDANLRTLRELIRSPIDAICDNDNLLNRFLIATPPAISSGIRLHASSAALQLCESEQEMSVQRVLHPLLSSVGVFNHCSPTAHIHSHQSFQKAFPPAKAVCPCSFLSSRSWLQPAQLHSIINSQFFQFPDPRLIQYDCGKLQRLDSLLRDLISGQHRVLIFTQMARMLDILEQFLAYHGYRYLRLDGTTKVEQRQVLMERFNMDSRIFVFILSTRSGGLGVNLTGADTVIFYDSDWNPTMDAQAQDRCHRIGQTRDVHIYRLISERTVEENILRKANQKRLLADVAIEGGKFTTAFFKQSIISDLFAEPSGLQDLLHEKAEEDKAELRSPSFDVDQKDKDESIKQPHLSEGEKENSEPLPLLTTRSGRQVRWRGAVSILAASQQQASAAAADAATTAASSMASVMTDSQWEAALDACEDENDRVAAKRALEEAHDELAEFDEAAPIDSDRLKQVELGGDGSIAPLIAGSASDPLARFAARKQQEDPELVESDLDEDQTAPVTAESRIERELAEFESMLRPIERFGVLHLESFKDDSLVNELEEVEAQIEESKITWKFNQLKALHEADEERAELEEDDILYCAGSYDPEAARLAELDELERAELAETLALTESATPRSGRGRAANVKSGYGAAPAPRIGRGRGRGRGRGATNSSTDKLKDTPDSSMHRMDSERSLTRVSSDQSIGSHISAVDRESDFVYPHNRQQFDSGTNDEFNEFVEDDDSIWFSASTRRRSEARRLASSINLYNDGLEEDAEVDQWMPGDRNYKVSPAKMSPRGRIRGAPRGRRPVKRQYADVNEYANCRNHIQPSKQICRRNEFEAKHPYTASAASYSRLKTEMEKNVSALTTPSNFNRIASLQHHGNSTASTSPYISAFSGPLGYYQQSYPQQHASLASTTCSSFNVSSTPQHHQTDSGGGMLNRNHKLLNNMLIKQGGQPPLLSHSKSAETMSRISTTPNMFGQQTGYTVGVRNFVEPQSSKLSPFKQQPGSNNPQQHVTAHFAPRMIMTTSMRSANIAPPHKYQPHPPPSPAEMARIKEPTIRVQTLSNGVNSLQPVRQVLGSSGKPVFIITRQMKTSSGEVYQQRITQPVQPPTQFVQVVRRMSQSPTILQPRGIVITQSPRPLVTVQPPAQNSLPFVYPPRVRLSTPLTRVFTPTINSNNSHPPPTRIIRVIRSNAPDAIRILQPRLPP